MITSRPRRTVTATIAFCLIAGGLILAPTLEGADRVAPYTFLVVAGSGSWDPAINNKGEIVYISRDADGFHNVFSTTRGQLTFSQASGLRAPSINDRGEIVYAERSGSSGEFQIVSNLRGVYRLQIPANLPSISDSGEVCFLVTDQGRSRLWSDRQGRLADIRGGLTTRCDINRNGETVYRDRDTRGFIQIYSSLRGAMTHNREDHQHITTATINNNGEIAFCSAGSLYSVPDQLVARFSQPIGGPIDMNDHGDIVFPIMGSRGIRIVLATRSPDRYPEFESLTETPIVSAGGVASILVNPHHGTAWIDPDEMQMLTIAVLTTRTEAGETQDFDAIRVDPLSVRLGTSGATIVVRSMSELEDVDGDGDEDLVLHFRGQATGIQCGDTQLTIDGRTEESASFSAVADISTPECP